MAICKKLSLNGYKWVNVEKFNSDLIKNYDVNSDNGYLLVEYPKELDSAHRDLPFLCEKRSKLHN